MSTLFEGVFARGGAAAEVDDSAWVTALLEVEAALAGAQADHGVVPREAADAIAAAAADHRWLDLPALAAATPATGNPVPALVRQLEAALPEGARRHVHHSATSQDVVDTALLLITRRAGAVLLADLRVAADAAAEVARTHRASVTSGRTLMQQALPTTFGLVAAGWCAGLDGAADRLDGVLDALPVQLGGAVGTLAGQRDDHGVEVGSAVRTAMAARLQLTDPGTTWHTVRLPVADLAGALATAAGVVSTVAVDLVLLSQSEVGEVSEGAPAGAAPRGGSSAMPHKRNPVAAISARACARRAPGLAATLYAAMEQEHQRAAGAWHTEWPTLTELVVAAGSAAAWLREALAHLEVHAEVMAATTVAAADAVLAGRVADELTPAAGRGRAHDLVAAAAARATGAAATGHGATRDGATGAGAGPSGTASSPLARALGEDPDVLALSTEDQRAGWARGAGDALDAVAAVAAAQVDEVLARRAARVSQVDRPAGAAAADPSPDRQDPR